MVRPYSSPHALSLNDAGYPRENQWNYRTYASLLNDAGYPRENQWNHRTYASFSVVTFNLGYTATLLAVYSAGMLASSAHPWLILGQNRVGNIKLACGRDSKELTVNPMD
jgi:hypothetical protein